MAVERDDPYSGFNFVVAIDGFEPMGFQEVSGLGVEVGVIEYRNGNDKRSTLRKMPGLKKYTPVVLRRGLVGDLSLWQWLDLNGDSGVDRRTARITLFDEGRQPVLTWNLYRAWPSKWEGPSLHAESNAVAIETLELTHEGLELE